MLRNEKFYVNFEMSVKNGSPNCNKKSTPPTKEKVRNPFDKALIERLHKPICSPGMCKIYKKEKNGTFRWDIDQACTLLPADIVACSSQFEPSPDPVLEKIAEEANEKFFSQELVVPSPLEVSKKIKPLLSSSTDSSSLIITSLVSEKTVQVRHFSAQTVLSLPPELPPEIETILQQFCTFTQDQNISGDYEITANGSLRRQLVFEEHSDMEHEDSEQTDDEIHIEQRPPSRFEAHTPITFSPDLTCGVETKGMKRTFGTPLHKGRNASKPCYRNKILDMVDFGEPCFSPIEFRTPKRNQTSATSSSLASVSISPVTKTISSSDEEKNNFTSPESEAMATCLDCVVSASDSKAKATCFCNIAPSKSIVKRSTSLRDSPPRSRKGSLSEKRSLSMSSLNRSRSVQKLDFSMDMSYEGSVHNSSQADSESSPKAKQAAWSIVEDTSIQTLVKTESANTQCEIQSSTQNFSVNTLLDETPIKSKHKKNVLTHEISKIRAPVGLSPVNMSLDSSLDNFDIPLCMEEKKIDFNNIDLKLLTDNVSQFEYNSNATRAGESSTSFKRVDSGFNENTFYASSYYESAIKPSELTVTNSKLNSTALKEISNTNWMRVDSGFKDETSADSMQFYCSESSNKKVFRFSEAKLPDKENIAEFEKFLIQTPSNNEAISMSDIFTDDMTFNCNFSSTPSKNKSRKVNN